MSSLFTPARTAAPIPTPSRQSPRSSSPSSTTTTSVLPTIDGTLLESQKENIRPLASGRSAAALSAIFQQKDASGSAAEKILAEGHERYKALVETAEARDKEGEDMVDGVEDVLDAYCQHINWATQHNTTSDAYLLPLIESATRRFITDMRYTQDIRYVKMWVSYTRLVERREEVWAFLESRGIGTNHAQFYEEWSNACESLGRKKRADEIFRIGIARNASPVNRLKSRHAAFLKRMLVDSSDAIPEDEIRPAAASGTARTPARSALGHVPSASTFGPASGSVSGATTTNSSQLAPANRLSKAPNGAKMAIFSDEAAGSRLADDGNPGEWNDFGTRDARRKENVVEATGWKGETLPVAGRVAPRTPKVEVFRDTSGDNSGDAVRPADDGAFRPRELTEAEKLKSDPLRFFDTSSIPASSTTTAATTTAMAPPPPPPPSARKPPRPTRAKAAAVLVVGTPWECPDASQTVTDSRHKIERRMFDTSAVFKGGDEWSFEEVRAKKRGLYGKEWKGQVKDWEMGWHKPGSSTPRKELIKKSMPSPTVNTKLANEEIAAMFDQTIHGGKVPDSDDSDSDSDSDDDERIEHIEEPMPIQSIPTPLPTRHMPGAGSSMMYNAMAMVPPTPTPAQGYVTQNRPLMMVLDEGNENEPEQSLAPTPAPKPISVFSDENANAGPPQSTTKPKLNIFSQTPAKDPSSAAVARTPLSSRSGTGRVLGSVPAFGVFAPGAGGVATPGVPASAVDQENLPAQSTISSSSSSHLPAEPVEVKLATTSIFVRPESSALPSALSAKPQRAVFETPAPKGAQRRMNAFAPAIMEEEGEEEVEYEDEVRDAAGSQDGGAFVESENADQSWPQRPKGARMSTIFERTMEYNLTQMTNLKSSQTGSAFGGAGRRSSSVGGVLLDRDDNADEDEDEDDEEKAEGNATHGGVADMAAPQSGEDLDEGVRPPALYSTSLAGNVVAANGPRRSTTPDYDPVQQYSESHEQEVVNERSVHLNDQDQSTTSTDDFLAHDDFSSSRIARHSGNGVPDFALPEGFTIHRNIEPCAQGEREMMHTMMVVDAVAAPAPAPPSAEMEQLEIAPRLQQHEQLQHEHEEPQEQEQEQEQDDIPVKMEEGNTETQAFVTAAHDFEPRSALKSPLSNPCNPSDDDVLATLLATIQPPLSALPGFNDLRSTNSNQLALLQKQTKPVPRRNSSAPRASTPASTEAKYILTLGQRQYEIREKIGEGGFGAVFLASDLKIQQELDDLDSDDEDEDGAGDMDDGLVDRSLVAIKVENPSSVWEGVVLDRIRNRIEPFLLNSIIKARDLYAFADESYLLLEFASQGTLLDIVNKAPSIGIAPPTSIGTPSLDELVAIFFTIELLKLVEGLHTAGFIHGDLKIDNCLVRLDPIPSSEGGARAWSSDYSRDGSNGWKYKGLKMIDFGRAIDMTLFPAGQQQRFTADWSVDEKDCKEMQEGKDWSYETDYFGVAGVCYCMLFGKYISTVMDGDGADGRKVKIGQPMKRYWQTQLWTRLFEILLNPHSVRSDGSIPITSELSAIRVEFEDWLEENCQKGGKNLRFMLKKVETHAITGKK